MQKEANKGFTLSWSIESMHGTSQQVEKLENQTELGYIDLYEITFMNDKLLEIACKSVLVHDINCGYWIYNGEPINTELNEFVKLIIEECSKTMCERDSFYGKWMGEIIKQRFEVE